MNAGRIQRTEINWMSYEEMGGKYETVIGEELLLLFPHSYYVSSPYHPP